MGTQVDVILMWKTNGVCVTDCTAIPGEACLSQHKLVRESLMVTYKKRKKRKGTKMIKL